MSKFKKILTLFRVFFNISAIALGGGLTMLPVMTREFVDKRHWMTEDDMVDTVAVMQSLPGIISINMGVLIGYRVAGVWGAVSSVLGVTLPPFFIIVIIAAGLAQLSASDTLNHIFTGVRASVAALIFLSTIKLGKKIVNDAFSAAVAALCFAALVFFEVEAVILIVAGAVAGLLAAALASLCKKKKEAGK